VGLVGVFSWLWSSGVLWDLLRWRGEVWSWVVRVRGLVGFLVGGVRGVVGDIVGFVVGLVGEWVRDCFGVGVDRVLLGLVGGVVRGVLFSVVSGFGGFLWALRGWVLGWVLSGLSLFSVVGVFLGLLVSVFRAVVGFLRRVGEARVLFRPRGVGVVRRVFEEPVASVVRDVCSFLPVSYPLLGELGFLDGVCPVPIVEVDVVGGVGVPGFVGGLKRWKCFPVVVVGERLGGVLDRVVGELRVGGGSGGGVSSSGGWVGLVGVVSWALEELLGCDVLVLGRSGGDVVPPLGLHVHNVAKRLSSCPGRAGVIAYPCPPDPWSGVRWVRWDGFAAVDCDVPEVRVFSPPVVTSTPGVTVVDRLVMGLHELLGDSRVPVRVRKLVVRTLNDVDTVLYHHLHAYDLYLHGYDCTVPPLSSQGVHCLSVLARLWDRV